MVPSMTVSEADKALNENTSSSENTGHHHHNHDQNCACETLKELGMVYYDPPLQKAGSSKTPTATSCPHHRTTPNEGEGRNSKNQNHHHHNHDPDHKCVCRTLEELGMVWHEPRPKKSGSRSGSRPSGTVPDKERRTVTAELHIEQYKSPTVEEILTETMKELKMGKESIHQHFQTTPLYKPLKCNDDIPDEYPNLQKVNASKRWQQSQNNLATEPRYVTLPSTS